MKIIDIYIAIFAFALLVGCNSDNETIELAPDSNAQQSSTGYSSCEVLEDGRFAVSLKYSVNDLQSVNVDTRVTDSSIEDGWAFVFLAPIVSGSEAEGNAVYADMPDDDTPLAIKSKFTINTNGQIFFYFDREITTPCFIRFMANLTLTTEADVESMNAVYDGETEDGLYTTFGDYKDLIVGLDGYYLNYTEGGSTLYLAPEQIRKSFPMASPGLSLTEINEDTLTALGDEETLIAMVCVGSKILVYDIDGNGFDLKNVTLLNGATTARMRSTVLANDGYTMLADYEIPHTGREDCVTYQAVSITNGVSDPIYLFPNYGGSVPDGDDGDGTGNGMPLTNPDPDTNANMPAYGDPATDDGLEYTNPTYLIIEGVSDQYGVTGFYKIALKCQYPTDETGEVYTDWVYDIIRNTLFSVNLYEIFGPGYMTFNDAVSGLASDIHYSITINNNGFDERYDYTVSNNGSSYLILIGSEIYIRCNPAIYADGEPQATDVKFGLYLNDDVNIGDDDVTNYNLPTIYAYGSDSVTVEAIINDDTTDSSTDSSSVDSDGVCSISPAANNLNFEGRIQFVAKGDGQITIRCGNILREIPVYYESLHASSGAAAVVVDGVEAFGAVSAFEGDWSVYSVGGEDAQAQIPLAQQFIDMQTGHLYENTQGYNRSFDGYVYPVDMGRGIIRTIYHQASNFMLYNNNTDAECAESVDIVYGHAGDIISINSVSNDNSVPFSSIQDFTVVGDVDVTVSGNFSDGQNSDNDISFDAFDYDPNYVLERYNYLDMYLGSDWDEEVDVNGMKTFQFYAQDIGTNQQDSGEYDDTRASSIENTAYISFANLANETKSYKFALTQSAGNYIYDDGSIEQPNEDVNDFYWYCSYVELDLSGTLNHIEYVHNGDDVIDDNDFPFASTYTYNSDYTTGSYGDYAWGEINSTNIGYREGYIGGSEGVTAFSNMTQIWATDMGNGCWWFTIFAHNYSYYYSSYASGKYQAYFILTLRNTSGEEIKLYMVMYSNPDYLESL